MTTNNVKLLSSVSRQVWAAHTDLGMTPKQIAAKISDDLRKDLGDLARWMAGVNKHCKPEFWSDLAKECDALNPADDDDLWAAMDRDRTEEDRKDREAKEVEERVYNDACDATDRAYAEEDLRSIS